MRRSLFSGSLWAFALLLVAACRNEQPPSANDSSPGPAPTVRRAAVAGLFYPRGEADLRTEVDRRLAEAKTTPVERLRALICPHAGYRFSGPIAATGYKQLVGRNFSTVILLGPSHYAAFAGAFVSTADAYETPLGTVPVSPKAAEIARVAPFTVHPVCEVRRPEWWHQSPKEASAPYADTPETWEHSLEVQLPFLQRTLKNFSIVPIVFGRVDPKAAAQTLLPFLDAETLIVVSSDLSHYEPYGKAKTLDAQCIKAICELRGDLLEPDSACGQSPLRCLIDIARQKGWKAKLLDARNSGDTSGDRSAVVGYAAIAFFGSAQPEVSVPPKSEPQASLASSQQKLLLELARKAVTAAATGAKPPIEDPNPPDALRARRACFVTLTKNGQLRGCIGSIFPEESLYRAVVERAKSAAAEDPRFPPVRPEELGQIEIEVSVLTVPKPLTFASPEDLLAKLRPGVDGVVLTADDRHATYLPQVWEKLPEPRTFMDELAKKAGLPRYAWRKPGATVLTYQVEAFKETKKADAAGGGS